MGKMGLDVVSSGKYAGVGKPSSPDIHPNVVLERLSLDFNTLFSRSDEF